MSRLALIILCAVFKCVLSRGPPTLWKNASSFVTFDVNENQSIDLHCPVMNSADLSIQWSKNNEDLDPMWSAGNLLIKRLVLRIEQARFADAGLYKCNVVNGFGNVQAQFQVNVKTNETESTSVTVNEPQNPMVWDIDSLNGEAPEFVSRGDEIQTGATKVIQPEGTTVQLKCLASGKPLPDIRWKKNGKILSEDEYGVTQSQILIIKDLRSSDTGNYTCELFNSFGSINATFLLVVTEKLQFFGNEPENSSVRVGQSAALHCRVQTNEATIKIQWLKKVDNHQTFHGDAIGFDSEQYEFVEQQQTEFKNNILSKSLVIEQVTMKEQGEYICLIEKGKMSNYKKVFLQVIPKRESVVPSTNNNENNLVYVMIVPLGLLVLILLIIFCFHHRRQKSDQHLNSHSNSHSHSNCGDSLKCSLKPRQPFIHSNGVVLPSTTINRIKNDYIVSSVDSMPISRQNQQRYILPRSSDLVSLTSSNLYYARVQPS